MPATKKKANVIKAYTDRVDSKVHLKGEVVELTEARLSELQEGGFVVPAETAAPIKTISKPKKGGVA